MERIITPSKPLTIGGGRVWLFPLDGCSESELLRRACLTPDEQIRFNTFKPTQIQRRAEWLAARVIAWEELGGRIDYEPSGRPILIPNNTSNDTSIGSRVAAEQPYISISHTTGWVALMVSESGQCGIDIETAERNAERIASRISSLEELELIAPVFPANPALALWCAKEAAYKALGCEGLDFKKDIRLREVSAQTLKVSVHTECITLKFFILNTIIGICGAFSSRIQ